MLGKKEERRKHWQVLGERPSITQYTKTMLPFNEIKFI